MGIIGSIIIGGLAGWLASRLMGTDERQGCLMNVLLGIAGGFVGSFILGLMGFSGNSGTIASLISGTLGAIILIFIGQQFLGRRR